MDRHTVDKLERQLEEFIADAMARTITNLPLNPSPRTIHLMAKAAITVYESAVENQQGDE